MKFDLKLTPIQNLTENGSITWIWAKTIKLIEENIVVNPYSLGLDNGWLDMIPEF